MNDYLRRDLTGGYEVVAGPDHPLVMRSVDVLVGGLQALTAILIPSALERRSEKALEARLLLNKLALPEHTKFLLATEFPISETLVARFDEAVDLHSRSSLKAISRYAKGATQSPSDLHPGRKFVFDRFANTYRLSRVLLRRNTDRPDSHGYRATRAPIERTISPGIRGIFFDGEPTPELLSRASEAASFNWYGFDNAQPFLKYEYATTAFLPEVPEYPNDPDKLIRASAFSGLVLMPHRSTVTLEQVSELIARYTRAG